MLVPSSYHLDHALRAIAGITALSLAAPGQQADSLARASNLLEAQPLRFVPNVGQWDSPELYRARSGGLHFFLERRGWSFWMLESPDSTSGSRSPLRTGMPAAEQPLKAVAVRMTFEGGNETVSVQAGKQLTGLTSYFVGGGSRASRPRVPSYASVTYSAVYPGIDVCVRDGDQRFEYDLLLAPGADLEQVRVKVAGAKTLRIDSTGALLLETELGTVQQAQPQTWMVATDGSRRPLACRYVLRDRESFGFAAPQRDASLPMVVDPQLLYSTFLGGFSGDGPNYIRQDANGRILIGGWTQSTNFPIKPGSLWTTFRGGTQDGFITCLDPAQPPVSQMVFSTYIGGSDQDAVVDFRLMAGGAVAFAGVTRSVGLPTTAGAVQPAHAGGQDGLMGLLDPTGTTLLGLTYHGGSLDDFLDGLAVAANGNCVLTGGTQSSDFPVSPNAFQAQLKGSMDGFISELSPAGTARAYSTYLGGGLRDSLGWGYVDAGGLTVHAQVESTDFPVTAGAFDTTHNGGAYWGQDVVVLRWNHWLYPAQPLRYSTFLGGSSDEFPYQVYPAGNGQIVVTGTTASTNFPTTAGTYSPTFNGGATSTANLVAGDAFVLRLDPQGQGAQDLVFSTHVGGPGPDQGLGSCVDSDGVITLVGWTQTSTGLPFPTTPGALRRTFQRNEGHIARLSANGRQLLHASYVGGSLADGAWYVDRISDGVVTVVGGTLSPDFQTKSPVQSTLGGGQDGFISRFALVPTNTSRYGQPSASPLGWPTIHALGDAVAGNQGFGLACSRAGASRSGVLLISANSAQGLPVLGINLYVDLNAGVSLLVGSDTNGECSLPFAYPAIQLPPIYAQFVWLEGASPLALSASDAMKF